MCSWSEPPGSGLVARSGVELRGIGVSQLLRFQLCVSFLRSEPVLERLAVVVKYRRVQIFNRACNRDTLCVAVLNVCCRVAPVKHRHRRIDPAAKFSALDAVDKVCAIAGSLSVGREAGELSDEFLRKNVISIECEDPPCRDAGLFQAELPLISMAIECSLKDAYLRK